MKKIPLRLGKETYGEKKLDAGSRMDNPKQLKPRQLKFGNTTVQIYSELACMTDEEQREWFKDQWKKKSDFYSDL